MLAREKNTLTKNVIAMEAVANKHSTKIITVMSECMKILPYFSSRASIIMVIKIDTKLVINHETQWTVLERPIT